MNTRDEEIINVLLKIGRICGTFPSERPSRWIYCYQVMMFIFNILSSVFCIYSNAATYYPSARPLDIFTNFVTSSFVAMQGLSFQFFCLFFPEKWRTLYEDIKFNYDKTTVYRKMNVFVELLILHLFFLIRVIFSFWTWFPLLGLQATMNYFLRYLNDYYNMISIVLLVHVNIVIKKHFFSMNKFLIRSNYVQYAQKVYGKTTQLLEDFNYTFGYPILFMMGNVIALMLDCLNDVLGLNQWGGEKITVLVWDLFYSLTFAVN